MSRTPYFTDKTKLKSEMNSKFQKGFTNHCTSLVQSNNLHEYFCQRMSWVRNYYKSTQI